MSRKFRYLTSVSVLASMVMNQTVMAMECPLDDEKKPIIVGSLPALDSKISSKSTSKNSRDTNTRSQQKEETLIPRNNSTVDDISDAVYHAKNGLAERTDPRKKNNILNDTFARMCDNFCGKISVLSEIAGQVRSGKFDGVASEFIEFFIADLAGEGTKSFLGKSNKEFDMDLLVKASSNLVDKFTLFLTKNRDIYGISNSGEYVTIYNNKSLFKILAQAVLPNVPFVTTATITLLDNNILKDQFQKRLVGLVFANFKNTLEEHGITIKQQVGKSAEDFIKSMIYDESSVDFNKIWTYLRPYLAPFLRTYMIELLKVAKKPMLEKMDSTLRTTTRTAGGGVLSLGAVTGGYILNGIGSSLSMTNPLLLPFTAAGSFLSSVVGSTATGAMVGSYAIKKHDEEPNYFHISTLSTLSTLTAATIGPYLTSTGTFLQSLAGEYLVNSPYLANSTLGSALCNVGTYMDTPGGVLGPLVMGAGSVLGHPLVLVGCVAAGAYFANNFFDESKDRLGQYIDDYLEFLAYELVPYSLDEHALNGLDPDADDIEKGIFYRDYQRRDELLSKSFVSDMLNILVTSPYTAFCFIFGGADSSDGSQIPYSMAEQGEQAYRKLISLKKQNPEEYERILSKLKKYPSFQHKMKDFNRKWNPPSTQESQDADNKTNQYEQSRIEIVENLEEVAGVFSDELITSVRENLFKEHLIKKFYVKGLLGEYPDALINKFLFIKYDEQFAQINSSRDSIYGAILDGIMASSIQLQDFIIPWAKELPKDLKQCLTHMKYDDLFVKNAIQIVKKNGEIELPQINKEKLMSFFKPTSTEITWADYFTSFFQTTVKEPTVADFVQVFIKNANMSYFKAHDLDSFKRLSITEGLNDESVINLHKRFEIYKANNANIFDILGSDVTKIILNLLGDLGNKDKLKDNYLLKLSLVSPQFYKLSLDTIDERKFNGLFNLKILNNEEREYLIQNYHDLVLIAEAYNKLKLDRLTYTLCEILGTHLEKTGVVEKIKLKIKAELSQNKGPTLSLIEMAEKVNDMLNNDDAYIEYHNVNEMIRPYRETDTALDEAFKTARGRLIMGIAESILNSTTQSNSIGDWIWGVFGRSSSQEATATDYALTVESVKQKFEHAKKTLDFHDASSKGVRAGNLLDNIKLMNFDNDGNFSIKDFIRIHQNILRIKLTEIAESDKDFVIMYGKDIFGYKSMSPCFRNWLFDYKYSDTNGNGLIQKIRKENKIVIELINPKNK